MKQSHSMARRLCLTVVVSGGLLMGSIPVFADDNLVVSQRYSVATNLGLFGGQAQDIAVDPLSDSVYFASFSPNGIFSSSNQGDSWFGLPTDTNYGTGKAVEVDPVTEIVYALVGDSIIKSEDQGVSWEDISTGLDHPILGESLLFAHDRLLVARSTAQVAVSEDGGVNYSNYVFDDTGSISYIAAATGADVYYVISSTNSVDSLYRSTDGGVTWTDMNVNSAGIPTDNRFYEIGVDPLNDNHLVLISHRFADTAYQSFNAGTSWLAITDQDSDTVHGTHVTFDGVGRMYIGSEYTEDATVFPGIWTSLTTETPASVLYADSFAVEPEDPSLLYTNSSYGVARSTDRGMSWEDVVDGVTAVKVFDVAQAADKNIVWIGANGGLAKTENFRDSVPTWEYPITPTTNVSNVEAVWVKPNNPDIVVMGGATFFYYSDDGGTTWTQSVAPAFSGRVQDIIQSPVNPSHLFAIFFNNDLSADDVGGVFKSEDNGQTWVDLVLPGDLPTISLAVALDETVYVGIGGDASVTGIYAYDGSSWSALSDSPQNTDITSLLADPSDANIVLATTNGDSGSGAVYETADAGVSWDSISTGLDHINNLDTLTLQPGKSVMYLAGQNGNTLNGVVYKSTDNGVNWSHYYTGLRQETFYTMLFDGLVVGNDQGLFSLETKARLKLSVSETSVQSGTPITLTGTLKDKATGLKLGERNIKIYKKVGTGSWRLVDTKFTNNKGQIKIELTPTHNTRYKLRWVPKGNDAEEYLNVTSSIERVTVH